MTGTVLLSIGVGLFVFVLVFAFVVGAVISIRSKGAFGVELPLPAPDGEDGKVTARFDTEAELLAFVESYNAHIHAKPDALLPYDPRGHADRLP